MMTWRRPTGPQVDLGERIGNALSERAAKNTHTKMSMKADPDKDGAYHTYIGWRKHTGNDRIGWCKEVNSIAEIRIKLDENPPITVTYAPHFELEEGARTSYGIEETEIEELTRRIGSTLEHFNPRNHPEIQ